MTQLRRNKLIRVFGISLIGFILLQFGISALLGVIDNRTQWPAAEQGAVDLTQWDAQQGGIVKLGGEWAFYWERHVSWHELQHDEAMQPDLFATVPAKWNGYRVNGTRIPAAGYGTYKLTVKVKEPNREMALKVLPLGTAYEIYVNDQWLGSAGKVETDAKKFEASGEPHTFVFVPPGDTFDLIVHVSNYHYAKGGMLCSLMLGSPDNMQAHDQSLLHKDFFLMGFLVIAVFYSIAMYFMNREEKVSLYFGLVCLVFLCRIPISGGYYIYELFPSATLALNEWINYTTFHIDILFYALLIREFFPSLFSRRWSRAVIVLTLVIVALLIILPLRVYSQFYLLSDALGFVVLAYPFYIIIAATIRGLQYSRFLLIGNGLVFTLVIQDVINTELNRYEMNYFTNYGILSFTFIYSLILGSRFSLSLKASRSLSNKLLAIDKLKDEFLAITSHELKTPLQGIISLSESLREGVEGPLNERQKHNLKLVISSGRRLTQLINDILDVSKLKHGDLQLSKNQVHVKSLVEFVMQVSRQIYAHKQLKWSFEIPDGLPPVIADENRLVQVIHNLVDNAAKFTEKGEVKVTAEAKSGMVYIHVSDTGIGIRPEQLQQLFEPFTHADASTTRLHGGVGLGLSITKYLVDLHGGSMEVDSTPGEGSRFTVILPHGNEIEASGDMNDLYELPSLETTGDEAMIHQVVQSGEHILVVDDERAAIQSIFNLLKLEGYTVTAVTSGKEALETVRRRTDIRLVILDVMMPEMSGYEVCRRIRETYSFVDLPILMVTAKHQPEDLVLGYDAGANDFLVKPFEPAEFKARVRTLIEWNQSMNRAIQSELAFLQAQIKPHFFYNALGTISYFCTRDGAKAKELLNMFAEYLRSHFDFKKMDKPILLEREIQVVKYYLEIEKERFGSRLDVRFEVDEQALAMKVPPFIMQPLVENAVLHGVLKKLQGGTVLISVKLIGDELVFRVQDNGVGMTEDQAANLLSGQKETGIGFANIQARLKRLYGREMVIHSVEGKGTEVTFSIPATLA